ncbi:IS4 family transposase [Verrucomicrobium sp. BvORR034]|uniref:IS4 family transposase n=1 Tax=Verrucomicrobium sp. BvORR034 TaxID=1396418 RepID=UPI00067847A5|nr:IS4 family transposase [Verrucomicrobium sp. BvORR034]
MRPSTPFFPGVSRILFGRAPSRHSSPLSQSRSKVDALCLRQLGVLLGDWLPGLIASFKPKEGDNSRERIYTLSVTFWAFLSQVLDPGGSCLRAVCRLKSLMCSHRQELPEEDTAAYCRARARLPIKLLVRASRELARRLCAGSSGSKDPRRIVVMDGTGITLPDTPANREAYAYGPSQKPGCGFPLMKLVGLFDLSTGAWLATVKRGRRIHDSTMAWRLLKHLRAGDILVADRGFCSYAFIAVLKQRGIDVVMRMHHSRQCDLRKGRRLGKSDSVQRWSKPQRIGKSAATVHFKDLPPQLEVRVTRFDVSIKAHRTRQIWLVSTLLDAGQWSSSAIASLYLRRWQVELFFADIKTTMGMDMLRTRSPHMVARELLMHMIAYNVVRLMMARAQPLRELGSSGVLSFKGSRDRLDQWQWCLWSASSARQSRMRLTEMLQSIADDPLLERPHRREPRCKKRRPKNYQLMSKPRHEMSETPHRAQRQIRKKDAA